MVKKFEKCNWKFHTLSAIVDKITGMTINDLKAYNNNQQKYLEIYKLCMGTNIPEIESEVSRGDIAPVNAFLRQRGFDIQLAPLENLRDLAIASIWKFY